jgi:hypothetical protein
LLSAMLADHMKSARLGQSRGFSKARGPTSTKV